MSYDRAFTEISEKRSQLIQMIVGAVVLAVAIGLLINIIYERLLRPIVMQLRLYDVFLVIPALVVLLFVVVLLFANIYLGKTFATTVPMTLLINRVSGRALPITYQPASISELILTKYVEEKGEALFKEEVPDLRDSLLRDLIEVIMVYWLAGAYMTDLTPNGRVKRSSIPFPRTSKKYVDVKLLDVLRTFGENTLSKLLSPPTSALLDTSTKIPKNFKITGYRYRERGLLAGLKANDKVIFRRRIGGAPGGSELIIEGSRLNPLKYFVVRTFIDRASYGDALFLKLLGYTPITRGKDRIECREKVFEGEELEEIRQWVEVDCNVVIAYKFRGWLFLHPQFLEVARWG